MVTIVHVQTSVLHKWERWKGKRSSEAQVAYMYVWD